VLLTLTPNLLMIMSIDTYGLSSEQYTEFFHKNIRAAAKLYLDTCNILSSEGVGNVDFKTVSEMYQEAVYTTNDDCRRYQKSNNPDALKENDVYGIVPSHQEIIDMIKTLVTYTEALDAKLQALTDYVSNLVTITTVGLEGIATTLDDTVD
jgi:hypothetical protein